MPLGLAIGRKAEGDVFQKSLGGLEKGKAGTGLQFHFEFGQRLAAAAGQNIAVVEGEFDEGAVTVPGQIAHRALHHCFKALRQGRITDDFQKTVVDGGVFDDGKVERTALDRMFGFHRRGQAAHDARAELDGLNPAVAGLAHAKGNPGLAKRLVRRVEIDRLQRLVHGTAGSESVYGTGAFQSVLCRRFQLELKLDFTS